MGKERVNSASAWRVADKKSDRHPGYSGTANIDGVLYFLDLWVKERDNGEKFMSMSFKRREKQEGAAKLDENDDVPM